MAGNPHLPREQMMRKFKIEVAGLTPLLMHNGRTVNPVDPATKEIENAHKAYQNNKTEENFYARARAEFMAGLYYHKQGGTVIGPYWPSDNLHTAIKKAGAKVKRGRSTLKNPVAAAVMWDSEINPLSYSAVGGGTAPRDAEDLWEDENYRFIKAAKVGQSKVMRTRPIFRDWKFDATGKLDTEILDLDDLVAVVRTAGQLVGLGDWRPEKGGTYGRFVAQVSDMGEYDPLVDA
jgi:hypothetical protein